MLSKGVVLIFLLLGLSSSIAHAIPHQNRAENPCDVRLFLLDGGRFRISHHIQETDTPNKSHAVLASSPSPSTTDKGADTSKSASQKGISTFCLFHNTVLIARLQIRERRRRNGKRDHSRRQQQGYKSSGQWQKRYLSQQQW